MSDSIAFPCPRPGCDATALSADAEELASRGGIIWICGNGHLGPRLIRRDR